MKNHIGFINDHSGSMAGLRHAAANDYNTMIASIKDAANKEMQDTVVSAVGIGMPSGTSVERQIVISNPHVLKPVQSWLAYGDTPLYDGIAEMVCLFQSLPDAGMHDVSYLLIITTDGGENGSRKHNRFTIGKLMATLQTKGNWSFVFRVPKGHAHSILELGVPRENIQEWETTSEGMKASTVATTQAVTGYFAARASGSKSTGAFYADASKVNVAALEDISKKISLYVVPPEDNGIEMRPFILRHRSELLKGSAFYQLTKTESKVGYQKQVLVRDRATGKVFAGAEARKMIGLPTDRNARLHPGDHKAFDLFIQSESVNRKLVGGTGVIYWKEIGKAFTDADLSYLANRQLPPSTTKPVVQLPVVTPTNKPTPSPIPTKPRFEWFPSRSHGRNTCRSTGRQLKDAGANSPANKRWYADAL
jgi:hypothetical protein